MYLATFQTHHDLYATLTFPWQPIFDSNEFKMTKLKKLSLIYKNVHSLYLNFTGAYISPLEHSSIHQSNFIVTIASIYKVKKPLEKKTKIKNIYYNYRNISFCLEKASCNSLVFRYIHLIAIMLS